MRVILADDHRIVREGISTLLEPVDDVEIVGEASGGEELLELLGSVEADVILLDLKMPEGGGLEVLERIGDDPDAPRVIVLSMYDDPVYVKRAIELGASGYLLKSSDREELLRALRVVAEGGSYIQGEITAPLIAQMVSPSSNMPVGELSSEDIEILALLACGLDNRAIAERLGESEATVKSHLRSIYARLGVTRRSEAVAVAFRLGIIS
ncbi:MAG: response regulator [Acidimicrobiia bacterium]